MSGESAESLKLTGREKYTIRLPDDITPGQIADVQVGRPHFLPSSFSLPPPLSPLPLFLIIFLFSNYFLFTHSVDFLFSPPTQLNDGWSFKVKVLFDTDIELEYFKNGGILNFMVRKLLK